MKGINPGFIAYPWSIEEHEFEGIGGSLSGAAAETDPTFPIGTRYKTETILSELEGRFKFARQKSRLAGTIRGSYFVIKGDYELLPVS